MNQLTDRIRQITDATRGFAAAITAACIDEGAWLLMTNVDAGTGQPGAGQATAAALRERTDDRPYNPHSAAHWTVAIDAVIERWGRLAMLAQGPVTDGHDLLSTTSVRRSDAHG